MVNTFDNHFAIIVGIDNYGQSSISSLQSAQKDASDLHDYLTKFGGYKTDNVKLITGDKATKHTIDTCIDEYKGKFTNDSTLLFYFSGHGSNLSGNFILPLYNFNKNAEVSFFNSEELIKLSDGGFDDVFVMVPVPALFTMAEKICREDGCVNFFAGPAITLLIASLMSCIVMIFLSSLAARIAASLSIFSMSAPVKPTVVCATL